MSRNRTILKKNDLIRRTEKEEHRRNEIIKVQTLLQQGYRPVDIRNQFGYDYRTIRKYAACNPDNLCRNPLKEQKKRSILDPFAEIILRKLKDGMVLTEIYTYISNDGFEGKRSNFYGYCKCLMEQHNLEYHTQKNIVGSPIHREKLRGHYVSRKEIIDTLWLNKEISETDKEIILIRYPLLYEISALIKEFRYVFEHGCIQSLFLFIEKYIHSDIKKVANISKSLLTDIDAIENAVGNSLSNAFVEGNNNRLKMIKSTMYGRADFPLLRAKVLC